MADHTLGLPAAGPYPLLRPHPTGPAATRRPLPIAHTVELTSGTRGASPERTQLPRRCIPRETT
eukprot:485486-Pyramimonas_sp.AAC.1